MKVTIAHQHLLYELIKPEAEDTPDPSIEFEAMDYENELSKAFVLTNPYEDLEPCKSIAFDDRYTGKCKKLRREARFGKCR